jgi:hypothetical protein
VLRGINSDMPNIRLVFVKFSEEGESENCNVLFTITKHTNLIKSVNKRKEGKLHIVNLLSVVLFSLLGNFPWIVTVHLMILISENKKVFIPVYGLLFLYFSKARHVLFNLIQTFSD